MENLFNSYSIGSIELEGKGVDRYINYMEKEDGTPLTLEELEGLDTDVHTDLVQCKLLR